MSNYEQSNVGMGMVPHKKNCRCDECTVERLESRVAELEQLAYELNDWFNAYPEDIFKPLRGDPIKKTGDYDKADCKDTQRLIERLRDGVRRKASGKSALWDSIMEEAADALEAKDQEIERLREREKMSYEHVLRKRIEQLEVLLKVARCPNTQCTDGAIPHGPNPDGIWELEQCQWCYEREQALGEKE